MQTEDRFRWLVNVMEVKPGDRILEIGCGVGLAVEQIAPLLKKGKITAIDRSKPMIEKAIKRNEESIKKGTAAFLNKDFVKLPEDSGPYDKIFLFNINLFWTKASIAKEAAILRSLLSKKGTLYILYGPMVASGFNKIAGPVTKNLEREKFTIDKIINEQKVNCCCFIAKP